VLLRSVKPLTVYIYDKFWLRFANKPFGLDHLDDYEKHFTVMNYAANADLKQVSFSLNNSETNRMSIQSQV
jgi:tubulin--tyrosine ligase-like protein 12